MFTRLKINTATLICTAFVFRLLFANIGIISSSNIRQNNGIINNYFSSVMKRKKNTNIASTQCSYENSAIEICEEDLNNKDNLSKTNPLILIRLIYSFFTNKVVYLKSNNFLDLISCKLSSKKQLTASVLRI